MTKAHSNIATQLRNRIIKGKWSPGSRLPRRPELISEVGSNARVVQNAITQLTEEGFVEVSTRSAGTRVASNPPHLTRYYLIFPYGPNSWDHFWKALAEVAEDMSGDTCDITCFYGLRGHRDVADYQQMIADVKNKSVAGLIFASSADEFKDTPLLDTPGIPRVSISYSRFLPGIPKISLDINSFINQAVAHLLDQGRKKLAILAPDVNTTEAFRRALIEHGLDCNNAWIQFPRRSFRDSARCAVDIMMRPAQPDRPDGLIIADDNLIEGSVEGLTNFGISVPEELSIVTLNNFPHFVQTKLPVTRFGFDIPGLLDILMSRLQDVSDGKEVVESTRLSVISEVEFNKTNTRRKQ